MSYDQFLRFIFPEGMFDYFELSDFKEKSDRVEIYFEEKNIHPQEYATDNLESKAFMNKSGCRIIRCVGVTACCLSKNEDGSITVLASM